MTAIVTPAVGLAGPTGSVLSSTVRDADGTTGQDSTKGSGIKTPHLQNSAVTNAKLADGAVTDAKVSGTISASKISSAGLNADTVDGKHASAFAAAIHTHGLADVVGLSATLATKATRPAKVAIVASAGGDYTDLLAALDGLSTWCGTPSAANPCLVKIMPGVYSLSRTLVMQSHVDIEGSGQGVTRLIGNGATPTSTWYSYEPFGVVTGASYSEIRSLAIESSAPAGEHVNVGVHCYHTTDMRISDVSILASGDANYTYAVFHHNAEVLMRDTTVSATSSIPGFVYAMASVTNRPVVLRSVTVKAGALWSFDEYGGTPPVKCQGLYDAQHDPIGCQ